MQAKLAWITKIIYAYTLRSYPYIDGCSDECADSIANHERWRKESEK